MTILKKIFFDLMIMYICINELSQCNRILRGCCSPNLSITSSKSSDPERERSIERTARLHSRS